MGIPTQEPSDTAGRQRRRLPSFGTLLFIAFVVYWAIRALGNAGIGLPFPTTAPAPGGGGTVGTVTFGLALDDECGLTQPAGAFAIDADVWWRAELGSEQPPDAEAVVRTYRDGGQIERQEVPAEPEFGAWDVLCAGEPVAGNQPGTYRVEVWNGDESALLAAGSYTKNDASP
jgi:hypothetical protein